MPENIQGYESFSVSEILAIPNIPQPYIVDGLIYEKGKTVLVGKPKMGKSRLSFKTALSVAQGETVLDRNVKKCPVVFLEFDRRYLTGLIHELASGRIIDNMHIVPAQGAVLNSPEGYKLLLDAVHRYCPKDGSPLLVVIDHKSACFKGKENDDQPNRDWLTTLDKVADVFPVSYLVVCQAPKDWKNTIADLPTGSRLTSAWADTIVAINQIRREIRDRRIIETSSNYAEIDPIIYTKDFMILEDSEEDSSKKAVVKTFIKENWSDFVFPDISKKVLEASKHTECGLSTAWTAYNEVKGEMMMSKVEEPRTSESDSEEKIAEMEKSVEEETAEELEDED